MKRMHVASAVLAISGLLMSTGATTGHAESANGAPLHQPPSMSVATAAMGLWYTARSNHFNSLDSCNDYGRGATGNRTGNGYVPGTTNWHCYIAAGDTKYSIDLWYP